MLTSKDIKLLVESFKIREEIDEDLARLEKKMATKDMVKQVEKHIATNHKKVVAKIDAVFKELKDFRWTNLNQLPLHFRSIFFSS